MKNNNNPAGCGRKEDLVTYLYDEADAVERASFERHLADCGSCRSELSGFTRVRDDLGSWEVGFTPRTEIAFPKSRTDSLREFLHFFPAWARGAALTAASLALLVFALSYAGLGLSPRTNSERIESLVEEAVAREREQMQRDFRAQMADYREQLKTEHELQLKDLSARQAEKLEAVKTELKRFNRQNPSIRSFFAMDDTDDQMGDHQ